MANWYVPCPQCKAKAISIEQVKEHPDATFECPKCKTLLIIVNESLQTFKKWCGGQMFVDELTIIFYALRHKTTKQLYTTDGKKATLYRDLSHVQKARRKLSWPSNPSGWTNGVAVYEIVEYELVEKGIKQWIILLK